MEIRQIEYILAIYEEKSISRAAERLGISQPALSQQLSRLEEKYGVQFFQRNSRNLRLTAAGELFLENGRRILEIQKQTDRELFEFRDSSRGSFSVGVSPGRCTSIVSNSFPSFRQQFPQYKIKIIEKTYQELADMILKNELDLLCTAFPDNTPELKLAFNYRLLEREEIQLAVSESHPLASRFALSTDDGLPIADLSGFADCDFALPPKPSVLRTVADQSFATANINPDIVYESHNIDSIYRIVTNTDVCTFVPASYVPPERRQVHLHLCPARFWDFSICWAPTHFLSQAEKYFIEQCYESQREKRLKAAFR